MFVVSSYSFYCVVVFIPGTVWAAHWPAERTAYQLSQWQHEPQHSKTADLGWNWHYHTHHLHPAWHVYRKKSIQTLKLTENNNKWTRKVMCTFNLSMDNLNVTILIDLWLRDSILLDDVTDIHFRYIFTVRVRDLLLVLRWSWRRLMLIVIFVLTRQEEQ